MPININQSDWVRNVAKQIEAAVNEQRFTPDGLGAVVQSLDAELQQASVEPGQIKAQLFQQAFDRAGLQPKQREAFIAALGGSTSYVVREVLASEIKRAMAASQVQNAPLPEHVQETALDGHPNVSFLSTKPSHQGTAAGENGVNMFEIPASCWIIPQLPAGSPGGVAKGAIEHAQKLASNSGGPVDDHPAMKAATAWQRRIETHPGELGRGEVSIVSTESDAPDQFALRLAHSLTTPPAEFQRPVQDFKTDEAWMENRALRFDYAERTIRSVLTKVVTDLENDPGIETSAGSPAEVVMPLLLTGPKGTLYEGEAGALYRDLLTEFADKHPGIKFKVAMFDGNNRPDFHTNIVPEFAAQFTGQADLTHKPVPTQGPREMWQQYAASVSDPKNGASIDRADITANLSSISTALQGTFADLPDGAAVPRDIGLTQLATPIQRQLFWQLHRLAEIPELFNKFVSAEHQVPNGDAEGLQDVTKDRLAALLQSDGLTKLLTSDLADFKCSPDRAADVVSLKAAVIIQSHRTDYVDAAMDKMKAALAEKDGAIEELLAKVESNDPTLADQVRLAQSQLTRALKRNEGLETALTKFEGALVKLTDQHATLQDSKADSDAEIRRLMSRLTEAQTSRTTTASTLRRSASSESASVSTG